MKCSPGARPHAKGLNWIFSFEPQASGKINVSRTTELHVGTCRAHLTTLSPQPHHPHTPYPPLDVNKQRLRETVCVTQQRCLVWQCVLSPDEILTLLLKETLIFFQVFYSFTCMMKSCYPDFFFFQGKWGKLGVCSRHWNWGQNNSAITSIWYELWWGLSEFLRDVISCLAGMFSCPLKADKPSPDDLTNISVLS